MWKHTFRLQVFKKVCKALFFYLRINTTTTTSPQTNALWYNDSVVFAFTHTETWWYLVIVPQLICNKNLWCRRTRCCLSRRSKHWSESRMETPLSTICLAKISFRFFVRSWYRPIHNTLVYLLATINQSSRRDCSNDSRWVNHDFS